MNSLYLLQIQTSEGADMLNFYFESESELSDAIKSINKKLRPLPVYRYMAYSLTCEKYTTIEVYAFRVFIQQGRAWKSWKRKGAR